MTLLLNHLEQISGSARSIGELQFPPPKIFTNALLGNHEITTLIRDTEPHERALFSVDPYAKNLPAQRRSHRRTTAFSSDEKGGHALFNAGPRKQSAVARVLGSHMLQEIEATRGHASNQKSGRSGGVNVEVLLKGAEKLCAVYPVVGAPERITSLRSRFKQVAESVAVYEARVASQTAQLSRMNKSLDSSQDHEDEHQDEDADAIASANSQHGAAPVTDEELRTEEQAIRELEQKKRELEERVASMEKDLGGLLR
ncbi:hypothetical protein EPUS_05114 [Endocarpon pusillum Z07020]|uniref:DASH complex subunit SPC34 n=1 Tax=Endocarpon pusillum (strain Z07020 / HMAS-L-300199) TaxID=1263415 RepID=U1G0M3_ENDPU|nr:uncharacterized protein EPUS_05114 [Endocarpon pusillum Z07020]ERF70762.1 hypothetical protein EPUS_05114 [Endocarpon pusillum Z07020]